MTNTNNTNKVEDLKIVLEGKSTSFSIRYLYSIVEATPTNSKVAQVEKLLKQIGVTTKNGDPIRYQHVRNVLTQTKLS